VLLKDIKHNSEGLTSDQIADLTALSRGTVVHHLNNLMRTGIVVSSLNKYSLKVDTLKELVDVVQNDADAVFDQLRDVGGRLDALLGLEKNK
jgi:predicted transcriptional regulator